MKTALLLLALLLLVAAPLRAAMITYKDEKGTTHVVTNPDDIPERYRGKSRTVAGTGGETGSGEVNLKLERQGNSLLVPVSLNGSAPVLMVLDTGASISMISHAVAAKLQAPKVRDQQIGTAGGVVTTPVIRVSTVAVQQFAVKEMEITVNDLPGPHKAQGLLGLDYFNHFRMQLDPGSGQLHLERK